MLRLATLTVFGLVALGIVLVLATAGQLPPTVATHFGAGGVANGWMPRNGYLALALTLVVALPLVSLGATALLPGRMQRRVSLPHADYWLAPARREETMATLRGFGAAMGIAGALLAIAVHLGVLDANTKSPPHLNEPAFIAAIALFVLVVIVGVVMLQLKFRRVPRR